MLKNLQVAVIGGDMRYLEIIRKLLALDCKISLVGFDLLNDSFIGAKQCKLEEVEFTQLDAIILAVGGTNEHGEVLTTFSNQKIILTAENVQKTPPHCTIYTGISNEYLNDLTEKTNRKLVRLFDRDDVAIYNSIPTAEGTIMVVMQNTDFAIHNSQVAILGFGRIGMTIARTFQGLGAKVRIGVRKSAHMARITEMGLTGFYLSELAEQVGDIDVCINTIPYLVVTANVIAQMQPHTVIIDLASKPGGTDFTYAEKRGMKAILAPSLPGIVAPKTAGAILANVLAELLEEGKECL